MRITSLKLFVLALAIMALAFVPSASATTCPIGDTCMNLVTTNLSGQTGPFGIVELSGNNSGGVNVTVVMNPGYAVLVNGGDIGINTTASGITLGSFSNGLSVGSKNNGTIFSFSFTDLYKFNNVKKGQQFLSTFSFTINNVTISQLQGFGFHLCVLNANGGGCATTGGVITGGGGGGGVVPEPGTLGLLGTGLVGLAGLVRRRLIS